MIDGSRVAWGVSVAAAVLAAAVLGAGMSFHLFAFYDDEGYVLRALAGTASGRALYTEVYSQYGPLFHQFYDGLHRWAGLAFTSDAARCLNIGYWLAAAVVAGLVTGRLAESRWAGLVGGGVVFLTLDRNVMEPSHPGALLALLSAVAAWLGVSAIQAGRERSLAWRVALVGAAMALIKINTGIFLLAALGGWVAVNALDVRLRTWGAWLAAWLAVMAAAGLFGRTANDPESWFSAWLFLAGAGAWTAVARRDARPVFAWGDIGRAAMAVAALVTGVVVVALAGGTEVLDLVNGVVLGPLRHPEVYRFPPLVDGWAVVLGLLGLVVALRTGAGRGSWTRVSPGVMAGLQGVAAIFVAGQTMAGWGDRTWAGALFYYVVPMIGLFLWRAGSGRTEAERAAVWVAGVLVWQTLHAYPVAGSQVAWGSFLGVPLWVAAWWRCTRVLGERRPLVKSAARSLAGGWVVLAGVTFAGTVRAQMAGTEALGLPGARWLSVTVERAAQLRAVVRTLETQGGVVFSLPGQLSLNQWSGRPTPTEANATHWFSLLGAEPQGRIREVLAADPGALVVVDRGHVDYLVSMGFAPRGELVEFIENELVGLALIGGLELRGHPGRVLEVPGYFRVEAGRIVGWTHGAGEAVASAVLAVPKLPDAILGEVRSEPGVVAGVTRQVIEAEGLPAMHLPPQVRLVLRGADGRELARLVPEEPLEAKPKE